MILIIIISLLALIIGNIDLGFITLLPIMWCSIIPIIIMFINTKYNFISSNFIKKYESITTVSLLFIGVKYGSLTGPHIYEILDLGFVFILQEFGQLFVPIIAMPLAIFLGMKKESIGACSSLGREPALGIISEKYGINSDEGTGVLSIYIIGFIISPLVFTVICSLAPYTNLNPIGLAMACGLGSTTMLVASTSALSSAIPQYTNIIYTYGITSTMLSAITDILIMNFLQLPIAKFIYKRLGDKNV